MDEVLRLASELGRRIAQHERFLSLREAERLVEEDAATRELLCEAEEHRQRIAYLEAEGRPVEPEVKRTLRRLEEEIRMNDKLQVLARAQADYMELMNEVNAAIRAEMDREPTRETQ